MTGFDSKRKMALAKLPDDNDDDTQVAKTRAKHRSFRDVAATAHAKGRDEGYAKAAQQYEQVQDQLMQGIKRLHARLDEGIWSRLTGLFKGGRHWPLYTTPPQRPWHGLTDEEITELDMEISGRTMDECVRAIEAKLKERNT